MVADNDLALGRIVEAVSHSPQWKSTCILVIEDDAQAGLDHVDGHRTVFAAYSPYIRRQFRRFQLLLDGLDAPHDRTDARHRPDEPLRRDRAAAFRLLHRHARPDALHNAVPANIALDDMNAPTTALRGKARYWAAKAPTPSTGAAWTAPTPSRSAKSSGTTRAD